MVPQLNLQVMLSYAIKSVGFNWDLLARDDVHANDGGGVKINQHSNGLVDWKLGRWRGITFTLIERQVVVVWREQVHCIGLQMTIIIVDE